MSGRLEGKVAIISGGARGMGAAHARMIAQQGASVLITDVLDDLGRAHADELRTKGLDVAYLHADVTVAADWQAAVDCVLTAHGRVTTLVNNAGVIGSMAGVSDETEAAWHQTVEINQTGVFLGMKHCIPPMKQAGGGSIVNICSIWGVGGVADYLSYQATKGAVRMMTRSAALSHVKDNIRVNNICPGLVMTEMAVEEGEENNAALIALTPMGRGAEPTEVSHAVVYLASDEASYVTGTELIVDGGYLAQ